MYTREYESEGAKILIPESYGGVAFNENESSPSREEAEGEAVAASVHTEKEEPCDSKSASALMSRLPFGNHIGKLLGDFKLGTEEIIIIAAAAFLLFSKERDIECALILIALLFIS